MYDVGAMRWDYPGESFLKVMDGGEYIALIFISLKSNVR
jgi:hypothetical protein